MTHQLNIFLLLFGTLQGILVSSFLLKNKQKHQSNLFLIAFLVVVGTQLTFKVINKVWLFDNVLLFYALSYYLPFLIGPLFYFFIRIKSQGTLFTRSDLIHFLPFVIGVAHQTLFVRFGENYGGVVPQWTIDAYPRAAIQILMLAYYGWFSLKYIRKFTKGSARSGLQQFLATVLISELLIVVALAVMVDNYSEAFPDVRLLFISLTVLIYLISYKLLSDPELFTYRPDVASVELKVEKVSKYLNSGLKTGDADQIISLLDKSMRIEKAYLNAELTIESLATSLKISKHHLSQVLNERFNQSYYDYVSRFRLEEAKRRLSDARNNHFTVAAIAFDSGFSSLSNFNDLFKKRFETTPSKFREETAKKMAV